MAEYEETVAVFSLEDTIQFYENYKPFNNIWRYRIDGRERGKNGNIEALH